MRLLNALFSILALPLLSRAASSSASLTIYAWPLTSSTPTPLASLTYDSTARTAVVKSFTSPKLPPPNSASAGSSSSQRSLSPESLLRIGLYDPSTKHWSGILTSTSNFAVGLRPKFLLHVDERGEVFSVGFEAERIDEVPIAGEKGKRKKGGRSSGAVTKEDVVVEVVPRERGPTPVLNKPVVLGADGKFEGKEPEKSFLQKYWWVLALFLLLQVVIGGGGDK